MSNVDNEDVEEETYVLQDFKADPNVPHPTILLVGKRFAGKSTMSVAIAQQYAAFRWAAWCGTKDTMDYWGEKFESSATVWGPDDAGKVALLRIIQYQERKVRLYKKILKKPFPKKYTLGLIFDDVTSKRKFRKGEILEDLFSNGRHYKSIIIISCQYIKQLPPAVRTNTDYLFMLHNTKRTCKILYEEYVENPDEFSMFLDMLRTVTSMCDEKGQDMYSSLVYNNCVKTNRLDEMFQVYRHTVGFNADEVLLGDPNWREYNKTHHKDREWEEEKRKYRRKKRMRRLQEYREKQRERKNIEGNGGFMPDVNIDLDYFSDSEEASSASEHETYTLQGRRGKTVSLQINNHHREPNQQELQSQTSYKHPEPKPLKNTRVLNLDQQKYSTPYEYQQRPLSQQESQYQYENNRRQNDPPTSTYAEQRQFMKDNTYSNKPSSSLFDLL
jgi:hypothetical protein